MFRGNGLSFSTISSPSPSWLISPVPQTKTDPAALRSRSKCSGVSESASRSEKVRFRPRFWGTKAIDDSESGLDLDLDLGFDLDLDLDFGGMVDAVLASYTLFPALVGIQNSAREKKKNKRIKSDRI